jgi:methyl-accepting chemotaxis protein
MSTTQPEIFREGRTLEMPRQQRLRVHSIGTRLFIYVLGSALVGLGTLTYLFYSTFKSQVERDIETTLSNKVKAVHVQLKDVERTSSSIGMTARALRRNGVVDPETYKTVIFNEFFKTNRPDLAMAISLGQAPNALAANLKWYYPYFYLDQKAPDSPGVNLPAPNSNIKYADLFKADNYPEKDYWKLPTQTGKPTWTPPYDWYGITMTTHAAPFYDDQGKLLGIAGFDVNVARMSEVIKESVLGQSGYFMIVDLQGTIAAYPPNPATAKALKTYKDVPGLAEVWAKVKQEQNPGLLGVGGNYWAYQRIPGINWMMLASLPQGVVLGPILVNTIGAAFGVAGLLGIVVSLFVRGLNRRLQPMLEECNKLAATDTETQQILQSQDELGKLSTSFFNLIHQLSTNEAQLKQEISRTQETQVQIEQQATQVEADNLVLQSDVEYLLETVSAVEEGDLTVQAPVSDRVTGLVADTFNRLVEELANIMAQVLEAAQQVSVGADSLEQVAGYVATNAEQQTQAVTQALDLSKQVEHSAEAAAQQLQLSNTSLRSLSDVVNDGQRAIRNLTAGTDVLREGTDRIVQQMKTLGEFVGLAEQFVQDQNQIATQTQVLALNASLVAARAAEQQNPKQFIVAAREFEAIADQVSKLAQQTNEGLSILEQRTAQIQSVVASVDTEVQNLGGLVGGFTQGVERSSQVFDNVQTVTAEVVRSGETVATSSQQMIGVAQSTATTMQSIFELVERTTNLIQNTRNQSEIMGQLSTQLLQRVEFFRLPAALSTTTSSQLESSNQPNLEEKTIDVMPTAIAASEPTLSSLGL